MAIKLIKYPLNDSLELLNFKEKIETVRQKYGAKNPFTDTNLLVACLDAVGAEEAYLVFFQDEEVLTDFIILKNSQSSLFRTPIPPEFPHFYNLSTEEIINLIKLEFGEVLLINVLFKNPNPELFKTSPLGTSLTVKHYWKLQVPEDFDRWVYKVKPKNQEKFNKMLKEYSKGRIEAVSILDPLEVQQRVDLALNKKTDLPLLSKNLLTTMLLELQTVGFNFEYTAIHIEEWEVGAMLSFLYRNSLYVLSLWTFFENSKYEVEDLLMLNALKEASNNKVSEIFILQDLNLKAIPAEEVTLFDFYLSK
jgi:hypothetical protein